jgi:hypothetical protein
LVPNNTTEISGDLYTCHNLTSDKIEPLLQEIYEFVVAHPKEIILLDFNHFYEMTKEAHIYLMRLITEQFGSLLANPSTLSPTTKLKSFWKKKQTIIVLYKHKKIDPSLWSQNFIQSKWMNTKSLTELENKLSTHLDKRAKDPARRNQFHVTQGVLTPDEKMVALSLVSTKSIRVLAESATPMIIDSIQNSWKEFQLNIVIVDYYHLFNYVPTIVAINSQRAQ